MVMVHVVKLVVHWGFVGYLLWDICLHAAVGASIEAETLLLVVGERPSCLMCC